MIRAVIIDDSHEARQTLAADLAECCPQVQLVAQAGSMREGLDVIRAQQPELVFLDIELGDGDGFQLLEQLGQTKSKVIFTTGMDTYGIRAVKFSALDYLLKPVDPDELAAAVRKFEEQRSVSPDESIRLLIEQLRPGATPKRLALNSADRVHVINIDDIVRCTSERNYTLFFLLSKKQILVTKTLKEYEELLEPNGFVRVHHSHLINMAHLKEFVKSDGGYALMTDGSNVPVSVRKREELMKALGLD